MTKRYDLVIIGTGEAAKSAAMGMRAAGWSVAIVDFRPFGGTCALRGCLPKKVLVGAADSIDTVRRMQGRGIAGEARIRWPELMRFKHTFTDPVPQRTEQNFIEKGIDPYHGCARFTARNTLTVDGTSLEARHFVIAAGAEPVKLRIPGEEFLKTSTDFLDFETLPQRIVFVGGGYIAAELSHVAARAGAQVTVLERGERMLEQFDPDLVGWLMEKFRSIGVDVRTRTAVEAIEKTGSGFTVRASSEGKPSAFEADAVIHAAGRAPALETLDLEAADIAVEKRRLKLNEFLQSISNPTVYAAGDAAQRGLPLTPVAVHDAGVVAANLLEGNRHQPDYRGVPTVAFTVPPIAAVGLSEAQAREQSLHFRTHLEKAPDWYTARRVAEPTYGFKVLIEEPSERILGAHVLGPQVDEVINLFALTIRHGLTAKDLRTSIFAYPTGASDLAYML